MFERLTKVKDDLVGGVKQVGGKLNPKHLEIASAGTAIAFLLGKVNAVKGYCENCTCDTCTEITRKAAEAAAKTGDTNAVITAIVVAIVALVVGGVAAGLAITMRKKIANFCESHNGPLLHKFSNALGFNPKSEAKNV